MQWLLFAFLYAAGSVFAAGPFIRVDATEWDAQARDLVGKQVELSGDLSTMNTINRASGFSNKGDMRGKGPGQMQQRADQTRVRDHEIKLGIVRGPQRPENFDTPYRSVRDTSLSMLFRGHPYNPMAPE
jgi:hypothetical protein